MAKELHNIGVVGAIPLASKLHEFKLDALAEAYKDAEDMGMLNPVGVGYLEDIPMLKDAWAPKIHIPRVAKGATGHYYLRKLSRPERKAWMLAFTAENKNLIPVRNWLNSNFTDMEEFVASGFNWDYTAQGFEWWSHTADRARWATQRTEIYFNGYKTSDQIQDLVNQMLKD